MMEPYSAQFSIDQEGISRLIPEEPGVYLFSDEKGRVLYVGKAKSLKKRLLSYLRPHGSPSPKTTLMLSRAKGLDTIITSSEKEAFLLESNLIKKHLPRYNVVLRDDKRYPCLVLDIKNPFPRLRVTRKMKKDGRIYFGPFSSAMAVRETLRAVDRIFLLRKCKGDAVKRRLRPCINYQIGRCLGPCSHEIGSEIYKEVVEKVRLFLEGKNNELLKRLQSEMAGASEDLDFEKAARLRDQINAVRKTAEKQNVTSPRMLDLDIVGLASEGALFQLVILFVRKGALTGSRNYRWRSQGGSEEEVMESFLKQYYEGSPFIPPEILVSIKLEEAGSIASWFSDLAEKRINIRQPKRGEGKRLVSIAVANARSLLRSVPEETEQDIISDLQELLRLSARPGIIEAVDISSLSGREAVGAIVAFSEGKPMVSRYRSYKIRETEGPDDYGMMAEVIRRRIKEGDLPDLIIVDGGRGHLETVSRVVKDLIQESPPALAAIAKPDPSRGEEIEKIYVPGRRNPITPGRDSTALKLLIRIRDEVHRRAISFHRQVRGKKFKGSELDLIEGLGPKRRNILLSAFRDASSVLEAGEEELASIAGIGIETARRICRYRRAKSDASPE